MYPELADTCHEAINTLKALHWHTQAQKHYGEVTCMETRPETTDNIHITPQKTLARSPLSHHTKWKE